MNFLRNKKWDLLFLFLLLFISWFYGYHKILLMRPYSIHQWRQADCLSYAINYYREGMHFFSPSVHWCGGQGDGMTVSEFPIIYYTVALLWKVFGYHEFIFRLLDITIVYAGLFCLYRICMDVLKDKVWAMLVPLYLFSSPILAFYGFNFLADVPGMSLAFIGWYFFWRFYQTGRPRFLMGCMFFFLLGGLIKITALLSFVPLVLIFLLEIFQLYRFKKEGALFRRTAAHVAPFVLLFTATVAWYGFAIHYNSQHNSGLFSTNILPIWKLNAAHRQVIYFRLYNELLPQFFNKAGFMFLVILLLGILVSWKKVHPFLRLLTAVVLLGVVAYLVLWFQVFNVHDYYLCNLLVIVPVILLTFLFFLKEHYPDIFRSVKLKSLAAVVVIISLYSCAMQMRVKYDIHDRFDMTRHTVMLDSKEKEIWDWYHWDYSNHFRALETITPYLRSLGIQRTDKVISMPDKSINISLVLMDQKGNSDFGYQDQPGDARMFELMGRGAKYLIVNDPNTLTQAYLQPFLQYKMGQYKNVSIYDLRKIPVPPVKE